MRSKQLPKLPTSPVFWRDFLDGVREIHGGMDDDASAEVISDVINMQLRSAEEAAAVIYFMTRGLDDERSIDLARSAAERWLDLIDIAAGESPPAIVVARRLRIDWNARRVTLRW